MLSSSEIEAEIIGQLSNEIGRRPSSQEISAFSLHLFQQQCANAPPNQISRILLRTAIKADPYASNMADAVRIAREITNHLTQREMPRLAGWVAHCEDRGLPLPVIISCKKYLDKARHASEALTQRFFGIEPIIIMGDENCAVASFVGQILCLPVSDTYEALPHKVFEAWTLLEALGARHGLIKIDDDLTIADHMSLDITQVRNTFARGDYMGLALSSPHHDRAWHLGKCASPVPPIYTKPFLAPWARGALYFLSKSALSKLTSHYLRFPGCLDGELYEDKAIGDVLHTLDVPLMNSPLEYILQIRTDAPERGLNSLT